MLLASKRNQLSDPDYCLKARQFLEGIILDHQVNLHILTLSAVPVPEVTQQ